MIEKINLDKSQDDKLIQMMHEQSAEAAKPLLGTEDM